jgi:hypothetical protein
MINIPAQHQTNPAKMPGQIVNVAPVSAQEKSIVAAINEYKESEAYRLGYRQGYEQGKREMYDHLTTPLFGRNK